jgi:hypothetical protein
VGSDYEVLSQRFFFAVLAFYHYSAVKVRGPFLRAGSILPPAQFNVKGSSQREQKTLPIFTPCEFGSASAPGGASAQGLGSFCFRDLPLRAKSLAFNLCNYSGYLLPVKANQGLFWSKF